MAQFQYLLPSVIHVQWLSLKGYWCQDQLINSMRSVFTSVLHSLSTKFCCMKWSLKFETTYICFYLPFLVIPLLSLLFLLCCFALLFCLFGSLQVDNYSVFILQVVFKISLNLLSLNRFSFLFSPVLLSSPLPSVYLLWLLFFLRVKLFMQGQCLHVWNTS